jgi:hypothetical protein
MIDDDSFTPMLDPEAEQPAPETGGNPATAGDQSDQSDEIGDGNSPGPDHEEEEAVSRVTSRPWERG